MSRDKGIIPYELPGGWTVLAGASDVHNDRLSTEIAEPDDWWFHVVGLPGSHVILRAKDGEEPSRATLMQAASVAAYHSKARKAGTVPVHCARARDVTKRRGAEAGTVEVGRGVVLKVRPSLALAERRVWTGTERGPE